MAVVQLAHSESSRKARGTIDTMPKERIWLYESSYGMPQRAIELNPAVTTTYYQLGQVLQKLGRVDEAKEQFEKMKYLRSATTP